MLLFVLLSLFLLHILFLNNRKKINLPPLKAKRTFCPIRTTSLLISKWFRCCFRIFDKRKIPSLWKEENNRVNNRDNGCSLMIEDMDHLLMWLYLGNRNDYGFLIPFSEIRKIEDLPTRVFIIVRLKSRKGRSSICLPSEVSTKKFKNMLKFSSFWVLRYKLKIKLDTLVTSDIL